MAKLFPEISTNLIEFIDHQKVFFVGTAADEGRVNISPKGMDTFRVISPTKIVWLNLTGSGNETAAHLLKNDRMTIMFCSFEKKPMILRLYGHAQILHSRDDEFGSMVDSFPKIPGIRQVVVMNINMVQTSCGYAVPFMEFKEERNQLNAWAEKQGVDKVKKYQSEKNTKSIDGFDTGLLKG